MLRKILCAAVASFGLTSATNAAIVNFEYTVTPQMNLAGSPQMYDYAMRFFIDMDELEASGNADTFGISDFKVNIGEAAPANIPPKPFGQDFVLSVSEGWVSNSVISAFRADRISRATGGFYWQPTRSDFEVLIFGRSEVLVDMTWNYSGRTDILVPSTAIIGTPGEPFGRLTSPPTQVPDDMVPVPLPAGFPLLLAGLGSLILLRRSRA